jgi:hypothetical protein
MPTSPSAAEQLDREAGALARWWLAVAAVAALVAGVCIDRQRRISGNADTSTSITDHGEVR